MATHAIGDVLFHEEALVWASFDEDAKLDKKVRKLFEKAYPKAVLKNVNDLLEELSSLESVKSLDNARNLLLLIAISALRNKNELSPISDYMDVDSHQLAIKLHYLDLLTASNLEKCVADMSLFREAYPKVIPKSVSNNDAGKLLGIINTNQLELEQLGGSGLFVGTAITEHSCLPNCSFTTHGSTLYMTAIKEIAIGERISIDYGNNFYHPTADRVESLEESYGFVCKCSLCLGPDFKRAFTCNKCLNGVVCPIGMGFNIQQDNSFSACSSCGSSSDSKYRKLCIDKEVQYKDSTPKNLAEIRHICGVERVLHESHYLIFWASDDIAMLLADKARSQDHGSIGKGKFKGDAIIESRQCYREALEAMSETVRLLQIMLPHVHHEKIMYYDRLGQLAVAAGELDFANNTFKDAYEMSCLACGVHTPCTLQILKLVNNPPKNVDELVAHYCKDGGDDDNGDGMDEC